MSIEKEKEYKLSINFRGDESDSLKNMYINEQKKVREIRGDLFCKNEDSGFDLIVPDDYTFRLNETKLVDLKVVCGMIERTSYGERCIGYYMYPRSSIYKYDLIMMNSTGIIDSGYRGNLKIPLKWLGNNETGPTESFTLQAGTRICQICAHNLQPFSVENGLELPLSKRGEGGFGSTGK